MLLRQNNSLEQGWYIVQSVMKKGCLNTKFGLLGSEVSSVMLIMVTTKMSAVATSRGGYSKGYF